MVQIKYDMIKAHGIDLKVKIKKARPDDPVGRGEGATFIVTLKNSDLL